MVTQITDYEDRAQARLPEQFKGKDLITALVRAFANETQDLEDAVYPMLDLLDISTMIGAQLDGIGDILTTPRDGKSDVDYRVALNEAAAAITASGTPEQVIERYIALTGLPGVVSFLEDFPAGYCIGALPVEHSDVQSGAPIANVILHSEDLTQANWVLDTDLTLTPDAALSPENTMTADELVGGTGLATDRRIFQQSVGQPNGQYTLACWARAKSGTATGSIRITDRSTDTVRGQTDFSLADAWTRIEVTGTTAGGSAGFRAQVFLDASQEVYVWGFQTVAGADALSYTKTDGIPVTSIIALVTGGIGTDGEYVGGYAMNVTRLEAAEIIRHLDDSMTLDPVLTNWLDTDVLLLYSETDSGDILSAMEAASGVGIYVGLIDLFALEDGDLFLLEDGDTMYVTYDSSGR